MQTRFTEKGISYVEVMASVIIITIVLISGYNLLIGSAKSTKKSEDLVDATYIAMSEMEEIYSYSLDSSPPTTMEEIENKLLGNGYKDKDAFYVSESTPWEDFQKIYEDSGEQTTLIRLSIEDITDTVTLSTSVPFTLTRIIIRVYDIQGKKMNAQTERTIQWGGYPSAP